MYLVCYIYINDLIKIVKERYPNDVFFKWLHILVLMDDTILLATSRDMMLRKVKLLQIYCQKYGMIINPDKTNFFVINGNHRDRQPLMVNGLTIEHCDKYTYLGSVFTSCGSVSAAVRAHVRIRISQVLTYVSFVNQTEDVPYIVKKRVLDAVLLSSLLYGCQSWVCVTLSLSPSCLLGP